jgi:hypothetical protein
MSTATTGYVLTKTSGNTYNWQSGSTTPIIINIVYSNSSALARIWSNPEITLNSNLMVSCNAANLPAGWQIVMTGETPVSISISTSGALNYNALQMSPTSIKLLYAKTVSTGTGNTTVPIPVSWVSYSLDSYSLGIFTSARNGIFGSITCAPLLTGLDTITPYYFYTSNTSPALLIGQPAAAQATTPNFWIPGNSAAILAKLYFEFNLNRTF